MQHEQGERVHEMIKHRLVPDLGRRVGHQRFLEGMRPEGTQRHRQKTERR